jgi:acyl carrier protein
MAEHAIRTTILELAKTKEVLVGIAPNEDFFEQGASSLTIVDLQIQIEEKLNKKVPTASLMANPTLDGWVAAFTKA